MRSWITTVIAVIAICSSVLLVQQYREAALLRGITKDQEQRLQQLTNRYKLLQGNVQEVVQNASNAKTSLATGIQESTEADRTQLGTTLPDSIRAGLCQHLRCSGGRAVP